MRGCGCGWGELYVCGVKRAMEMAGDEDCPALPAITHVACSYGPISTKTNYRRGNFMDRKNLSPSGTLPLRDSHSHYMGFFKEGKFNERPASNNLSTMMDDEEEEVWVRS